MNEIIFRTDSTVRLSCRTGDYLIWCRPKGLSSAKECRHKIIDVWNLSDGDFISITNRQADLPTWFELHPLEVSGRLVYWMKAKLDSGYKHGSIIDSANLWRVYAGDRLIWVGNRRSGVEFDNGVLSVYTFENNAIIIGDTNNESDVFEEFGGFSAENQSQEDLILCQNALNAVSALGIPRTMEIHSIWTMG